MPSMHPYSPILKDVILMVSCPLCTKWGIFLYSLGFAIILISILNIIPFNYAVWIGLGLIFSAYIVPNLIKTDTCNDAEGRCTTKNR